MVITMRKKYVWTKDIICKAAVVVVAALAL